MIRSESVAVTAADLHEDGVPGMVERPAPTSGASARRARGTGCPGPRHVGVEAGLVLALVVRRDQLGIDDRLAHDVGDRVMQFRADRAARDTELVRLISGVVDAFAGPRPDARIESGILDSHAPASRLEMQVRRRAPQHDQAAEQEDGLLPGLHPVTFFSWIS
jgi:hypothetical protein